DVEEFALEFLDAALFGLNLGQITDKADKHFRAVDLRFADRQFQREGRAVLLLASDDAANADDALFAGIEIAVEVTVMLGPEMGRHQHLHIAADDLVLAITEQ